MSNDRMTNVPDFLGELDAGVFMNKIAGALNTAALGVLNNGSKGKVVLTFDIDRMGNSIEEKRVMIKHKLQYVTPHPTRQSFRRRHDRNADVREPRRQADHPAGRPGQLVYSGRGSGCKAASGSVGRD